MRLIISTLMNVKSLANKELELLLLDNNLSKKVNAKTIV